MQKPVIITISRQYGSNGKEIGRKLAEYLDIGYYNKEIMEMIATELGIQPDFFRDENRNDSGLFSVRAGKMSAFTELSVNSQIYERASELIEGISKRESAVIVGRCADYILKESDNVITVFFYSDIEDRIRWSIQEYKVPSKKAKKIVLDMDQKRAGFYEFHTNQRWGDAKNYDMMINTSRMNTTEIVHLLASFYDQKRGIVSFKGAFEDQYLDQRNVEYDEK